MKFSLRSLIVLSLLVFLVVVANFERNRADRLANQLEQLESPMLEAIRQQEWLVKKRQLALDYSKSTFRGNTTPLVLEQIGQQASVGKQNPSSLDVGMRRELANIRNAELKLRREKGKLAEMQKELENHRMRIGK